MTVVIARDLSKPVRKLTKTVARRVLRVVDAGLCKGVGEAVPGQMGAEAAICYAYNLPHGDEPSCVEPCIRSFKINLNDAAWSSNEARAKGMRRAALAQLGSKGVVDPVKWSRIVALQTIKIIVPEALRIAAKLHSQEMHKLALEAAAVKCEQSEGLDAASDASYAARAAARAASYASDASYAARAASDAASYASDASYASERDRILSMAAEICVQACVECGSPGAKFLDLAPL